jgi:hypothetical protein
MAALGAVHAALRPGGVLLDVRPAPRNTPVQLRTHDARLIILGEVDEWSHIEDSALAEMALDSVIAARQFELERVVRYTVLAHFASVDAWLEYRAAHPGKSSVADELLERARALLVSGAGELRLEREVLAARLIRL